MNWLNETFLGGIGSFLIFNICYAYFLFLKRKKLNLPHNKNNDMRFLNKSNLNYRKNKNKKTSSKFIINSEIPNENHYEYDSSFINYNEKRGNNTGISK